MQKRNTCSKTYISPMSSSKASGISHPGLRLFPQNKVEIATLKRKRSKKAKIHLPFILWNVFALSGVLVLFLLAASLKANAETIPKFVEASTQSTADTLAVVYAPSAALPYILQPKPDTGIKVTFFNQGQIFNLTYPTTLDGEVLDVKTGKFDSTGDDCFVASVRENNSAINNAEIFCPNKNGIHQTVELLYTAHVDLLVHDMDKNGRDDLIVVTNEYPSRIVIWLNSVKGPWTSYFLQGSENKTLLAAGNFLRSNSGAVLLKAPGSLGAELLDVNGKTVAIEKFETTYHGDISVAKLNRAITKGQDTIMHVLDNENKIELLTVNDQDEIVKTLIDAPNYAGGCAKHALADVNQDLLADIICSQYHLVVKQEYDILLNGEQGFDDVYHSYTTNAKAAHSIEVDRFGHMYCADSVLSKLFLRGNKTQ